MEEKTDKGFFVQRLYFVDALRGICVLGMVVYHTLFDIVYYVGMDLPNGLLSAMNIVRNIGAALFIFISGFCFSFSKKPLKGGIFLVVSGTVATAITRYLMPDCYIIFGILTFMGISRLIMIPLSKLLIRLQPIICLALCVIFFLITFNLPFGYSGFFGKVFFYVPLSFYKNIVTAFFGFPYAGFSSADYFPFFPWFFVYLCGFFFYLCVKENGRVMQTLEKPVPFLSMIGKFSLPVYILHQPIILAVVLLISKIYVG